MKFSLGIFGLKFFLYFGSPLGRIFEGVGEKLKKIFIEQSNCRIILGGLVDVGFV